MQPIRQLTTEVFAPYGVLLAHDPQGERFQVFAAESGPTGWQVAVNRIANRTVTELARHPYTLESFAPIRGQAVLIVAPREDPQRWEAFALDQPLCLHKGVWHATLALSGEAYVAIGENLQVESELHALGREVFAGVGG